jgi:CRISPR/Cas system CSM-associated protein Csm3 (group 7 of RAMP superfamily)
MPDGEKTYGLDTLEIGGHGSAGILPESLGNHFVKGDDLKDDALREISPDRVLALTQVLDDDKQVVWQPFIPGTAFAGSFRHWLSHKQRRGGSKVWDPVAQTAYADGNPEAGSEETQDTVELLLGGLRKDATKTVRRASVLFFREAHLTGESRKDWTFACVEGLRIDPYAQKSADGAKFNRSALFNAAFDWELVLEITGSGKGAAPEMEKTLTEMVEAFLAAAERSRVAFGGGEFRGHGHLAFSAIKRERAAAGEEGWSESNCQAEET